MKNVNTLKIVTAVVLALGFGSAQAISSGTAVNVGGLGLLTASAVVAPSCSAFTTSGTFAFPAYTSGQATNADAPAITLSATCSIGTAYSIAMSAGSNFGLGPWGGGYRALANGANYLSYGVYVGAPTANVFWGDNLHGSLGAVFSAVGDGTPQTVTSTARIYAGQAAVAGAYGDATLVATITF